MSASVDVIRRLNSAFNSGDEAALRSLLTDDVEFVDHLPLPDVAQEAHGAGEMMEVLEQWREGFVGFHADVLEYIDLGDYVVCSTEWRFTSRDEGIKMDWVGAEAHQVRGDKVCWSAAGFRDVPAAKNAVAERRAMMGTR